MPRVLAAITSLVFLTLAGCTSESGGNDPQVLKAATSALDRRLAAVHDFVLEGTAKDATSEVGFTYSWSQPQFARAELTAPTGVQTLVFDGEALTILDHASKSYARLDRSGGEERLLLALHQAFSEVAVEGWRPPLLRPKQTTAAAGAEGKTFVLTNPIDDDELKEERLVLRAPDAAFVEKVTLDKAGQVRAATRVLEELVDPATGLSFPKRWERTGNGERFEVTLRTARVNGGVATESFRATIPAGFSPAQQPAQPSAP